MNILLYLIYGNELYSQEAKFSILTALREHDPASGNYKVVVCTDRPSDFDCFPIDIYEIDGIKLKKWWGDDNYKHRAKVCAMQEIMGQGDKIALVDSDTYFIKSPALLFKRITRNHALMHKSEGYIFSIQHKNLAKSLTEYKQHAQENVPFYSVSRKSIMWNSGIVGLHPDHRPLLSQTLSLVDELYGFTKCFNIEQFAFTEILNSNVSLRSCNDIVVHYWGSEKRGAEKSPVRTKNREEIMNFFNAHRGASFETLVRNSAHCNVKIPKREISILSRLKIYIRTRPFLLL